jgi:hypothetical protein
MGTTELEVLVAALRERAVVARARAERIEDAIAVLVEELLDDPVVKEGRDDQGTQALRTTSARDDHPRGMASIREVLATDPRRLWKPVEIFRRLEDEYGSGATSQPGVYRALARLVTRGEVEHRAHGRYRLGSVSEQTRTPTVLAERITFVGDESDELETSLPPGFPVELLRDA